MHKKKEKYEPVCIKPAGAHLFCDVLRGSVTDKNHTKKLVFSVLAKYIVKQRLIKAENTRHIF